MIYQAIERIRKEFRVCPSLGPLLLVGLGVMGGVCGFGWRGWLGLVHASFWVSWLHGGRRLWMSCDEDHRSAESLRDRRKH